MTRTAADTATQVVDAAKTSATFGPVGKPFAGFADFNACLRTMRRRGYSKARAARICGALQRDHEK